jgi:iron complex transport system ATP-binding protein
VIAVAARDVALPRGRVNVLEPTTLAVPAGQLVGLIGPNGAGKTSLLRCLAGLVASSGTVTLFGAPVKARSRQDMARQVSFIPQSPRVPRGMRVSDYVMLGRNPHLRPLAVESLADRRIVGAALKRLDIDTLGHRPVDTLSGGEMQRAVIARALAQQAPLMLLDEPTSALDLGRQQEVLGLIDCLRREQGLTVIAALHDLTLAGQYADRLLLLKRGSVVADGAPDQVLRPEIIGECFGAAVDVVAGDSPIVIPRRSA